MSPGSAANGADDRRGTSMPTSAPSRRRAWLVVLRRFAMAIVAGEGVIHVTSPPLSDLLTVLVAWICFYPVARLNPHRPWWVHWLRGVIVIAAFALFIWWRW
jgi:hypothetical protein